MVKKYLKIYSISLNGIDSLRVRQYNIDVFDGDMECGRRSYITEGYPFCAIDVGGFEGTAVGAVTLRDEPDFAENRHSQR